MMKQNETPLISIVVPVYKVEKYLSRCIDSILAQTYKNFELILVDDGSPDNCGKICDEYALKDSRIKVIHQENSGTIIARNTGIKNTKGKYLGFVDSDDYIKPQMYEQLYNIISSGNYDIVWCDVVIELSDRKFISQLTASENPNDLLSQLLKGEYPGWMWNKLISREFFLKCNVYQDPSCPVMEDVLIMTQLLYRRPKIKHLINALYIYNRTNDQALTSKEDVRLKSLTNLIHIEQFLKKKDIFNYYCHDFSIMAMKTKISLLNTNRFQLAKNIFPYAHKHLNNYTFQPCVRCLYFIFLNCGKFGYYLYKFYRILKNQIRELSRFLTRIKIKKQKQTT